MNPKIRNDPLLLRHISIVTGIVGKVQPEMNHDSTESLGISSPTPKKKNTSCVEFNLATSQRCNAFHTNCVCSYSKSLQHSHSPSLSHSASKRFRKQKNYDERSVLASQLIFDQPVELIASNGAALNISSHDALKTGASASEFEIVKSADTAADGVAVSIKCNGKFLSVSEANPYELCWVGGSAGKLQTFVLQTLPSSTMLSPPPMNSGKQLSPSKPIVSSKHNIAVSDLNASFDENAELVEDNLTHPTNNFSIRSAYGRYLSLAGDAIQATRNVPRAQDWFKISMTKEGDSTPAPSQIQQIKTSNQDQSTVQTPVNSKSTQTDDDDAVVALKHIIQDIATLAGNQIQIDSKTAAKLIDVKSSMEGIVNSLECPASPVATKSNVTVRRKTKSAGFASPLTPTAAESSTDGYTGIVSEPSVTLNAGSEQTPARQKIVMDCFPELLFDLEAEQSELEGMLNFDMCTEEAKVVEEATQSDIQEPVESTESPTAAVAESAPVMQPMFTAAANALNGSEIVMCNALLGEQAMISETDYQTMTVGPIMCMPASSTVNHQDSTLICGSPSGGASIAEINRVRASLLPALPIHMNVEVGDVVPIQMNSIMPTQVDVFTAVGQPTLLPVMQTAVALSPLAAITRNALSPSMCETRVLDQQNLRIEFGSTQSPACDTPKSKENVQLKKTISELTQKLNSIELRDNCCLVRKYQDGSGAMATRYLKLSHDLKSVEWSRSTNMMLKSELLIANIIAISEETCAEFPQSPLSRLLTLRDSKRAYRFEFENEENCKMWKDVLQSFTNHHR